MFFFFWYLTGPETQSKDRALLSCSMTTTARDWACDLLATGRSLQPLVHLYCSTTYLPQHNFDSRSPFTQGWPTTVVLPLRGSRSTKVSSAPGHVFIFFLLGFGDQTSIPSSYNQSLTTPDFSSERGWPPGEHVDVYKLIVNTLMSSQMHTQ